MQLAYRCPRCEKTSHNELARDATVLRCQFCDASINVSDDALRGDENHLDACLVCHSHDLFSRKDFPQRFGVFLVVVGFIASSIAWYYYRIFLAFGFLFATAGLDVLLYLVMGEALVCYRCGAHYRNVKNLSDHAAFSLETHERYRQIAARHPEK